MLRDDRPPGERAHSLYDLLGNAVIDPYTRQNKTSRNYPRKQRESPPGNRQIVTTNNPQRERAAMLRNND